MSISSAKFTLEHYEHMIACGAFAGEHQKRVELINGEIVEMLPIGPMHNGEVNLLVRWSSRALVDESIILQVQGPIRIPESDSEPEPDIAWLKERDYRKQHAGPDEVLLLIEVAGSSLAVDQGEKLAVYAQAGIPDYWIVNLVEQQIEVYREPEGNGYKSKQVFRGDEVASPLVHGSAKLTAGELFG